MKMNRVVITGIGIVSPAGNWPGEVLENVLAGHSAVRPFLGQKRPSPVSIAAYIETPIDDESTDPDRVTQLALAAGRRALEQAGLIDQAAILTTMAIYFGTGTGGIGTYDDAFHRLYAENRDRVSPMTLPRGINNAAASELAIRYGVMGANNTYSSACSSSSTAIGEAMRSIRHGYTNRVLAGGSESLLTFGTLHAWHSLRALAMPDADIAASCRPFSSDRTGLVLGEGAAFLVLESLAAAQERGATILAELCGYGSACDATHLTRPSVAGQVKAMQEAIADAGINPTEIDYVNAHGTGTMAGDAAEAESLRTVFGTSGHSPAVSSTKAVHGHLMGAGGALELAVSVLALMHEAMPPTANCRQPDQSLGIDLVTENARKQAFDYIMSNSFAFGGSNSVLIARRWQGAIQTIQTT